MSFQRDENEAALSYISSFCAGSTTLQSSNSTMRIAGIHLGWMLKGHIYNTMWAELPHTCVQVCREDDRCQSFNWVISLLKCEFSNRTKEARPEDLIPDPDRFYYKRDRNRGKKLFTIIVY